ncbi:MAG TPA: hypothetical protein VLK27_00775 [Chthoniobacterales bacterium]|nr:hypothetical protein [Chthoniobacterales bacterium]
MSKAMIKEIPLPADSRFSRGNSFEIPYQLRKVSVRRSGDQHMQVIGHQEKKMKVPPFRKMISPRGSEDDVRYVIAAKLI